MTEYQGTDQNYWGQTWVAELCRGEERYAKNYDWVLAIDADEFLWFDRNWTAKEFIMSQDPSIGYYSFGKWQYGTAVSTNVKQDSGFGLDRFSFTPRLYCYAFGGKGPNRWDNCPDWLGRCKILSKPQLGANIPVHGRNDFLGRGIHYNTAQAHIKEWPGVATLPAHDENRYVEIKNASFATNNNSEVGVHWFLEAFPLLGDGTVLVNYDESLASWFHFVASRLVSQENDGWVLPQRKSSEPHRLVSQENEGWVLPQRKSSEPHQNILSSIRSFLTRPDTHIVTQNSTMVRSSPLPSTGGIVHYRTTSVSGWNNQRQSATMAWLVAYYTGHSLALKPYQPAGTGVASDSSTEYRQGDLWDMTKLAAYVNIINITYNTQATESDGWYMFNEWTVFPTQQDVSALQNHSKISYDSAWAVMMQHNFPFLDPFQEPGETAFRHMTESFVYNQLIQDMADAAIKELFGGQSFIALHVRHNRRPSLNCTALGLETSTEQYGGCIVEWKDIVSKLLPGNNLPVYVAHDGKFIDLPIGWKSSVDFGLAEKTSLAIGSAVEQVIATRAEYFIGSTQSSWSEYVVYQRVYNKVDGRSNYDIWLHHARLFLNRM